MIALRDHNMDLPMYMSHMGALSEKHDKRTKEEGLKFYLRMIIQIVNLNLNFDFS